MKGIRSKKLWAGTLRASASAVLGLTLTTTSAPADSERQGPSETKTIRMVLANGPEFQAPQTIQSGQGLRILNQTRVQDTQAHFFSLFSQAALPVSGQDNRKCANIELPSCEQVAKAHKVTRTFNVRRRTVDKGQSGWNTVFTSDEQGDSWFSDDKGESEVRKVTAEPGTTLYYLCVIHPQVMRGSIRVEGAP